MDSAIIIAIITAVPPTLAALVSIWVSRINSRKLNLTTEKLNGISVTIDGRLSELLALTAKSSHAEGVVEGKLPQTPEAP